MGLARFHFEVSLIMNHTSHKRNVSPMTLEVRSLVMGSSPTLGRQTLFSPGKTCTMSPCYGGWAENALPGLRFDDEDSAVDSHPHFTITAVVVNPVEAEKG